MADDKGKQEVAAASEDKTDQDEEAQLEELLQEKLQIENRWKALQAEIESRRYPIGRSEQGLGEETTSSTETTDDEMSSGNQDSVADPSPDALTLLMEIRNLPPPTLKLTKPTRATAAEVHAENVRRNRIPTGQHSLRQSTTTGRTLKTTDDPKAVVAPSVMVKPLPVRKMPTFDDVLKELKVSDLVNPRGQEQPLYMADCRIVSQALLKDIIRKRAEHFVSRLESTKVERGTQTFVSYVGKQRVTGCVNCRSKEHKFKNCKLPYRPGFCQICGADGFDTADCIYPHGIEHEYALGRCLGCSRDLSLYCPECPDCNIRYAGIVDWLRLNYATWPTAWVPEDHQYLINEGKEQLKRKVKAKFDDAADYPNRVRSFLIRENALTDASMLANPAAKSATKLSEDKRQRAIQALYSPRIDKTLDEIMKERPELHDGEEIRVIIPTKYKK